MKIAILTQPLRVNYGGILQAYALQTFLQRRGHDVIVVNREYHAYSTLGETNLPSIRLLVLRVLSFFKTLYKKYILRRQEYVLMNPLSPFYHVIWTGYDVLPFVNKRIKRSKEIRTSDLLFRYLNNSGFNCIIVGSDQVWRPKYSPCIMDYFLKGLDDTKHIKTIAYAASFGTDLCEFTNDEIEECAHLLKKFSSISVREDSGVEMCERLFNVKVSHLIDPTLLLEKDDYINLALSEGTYESPGNLLTYILDPCLDSYLLIDHLVKLGYRQNKATITVHPTEHNPRPVQVSIEQWLRGFYDAELIVTDSFHACVFSIIFNKPFVVIGNRDRGLARIESLLKMFNLQGRLVSSMQDFEIREEEIMNNYDTNVIMQVLSKHRKDSEEFFNQQEL